MLKNLVIILLILFCYSVHAKNIEFDICHKKLQDFITLEQHTEDKEFRLNNKYVSEPDIAQSLMYTTNLVTTNPTYRLKLSIERIRPKMHIDSNATNVNKADSVFKLFVTYIQNKKYPDARMLMPAIDRDITDDKLNNLFNVIGDYNKLSLYATGVAQTSTNVQYLLLEYKYNRDKNDPPVTLVKVMFDTDYAILNIELKHMM